MTVIEYASASCPHCANFYKTTFQELKKEYIDTGKIRFVFREFPHNDAGARRLHAGALRAQGEIFPADRHVLRADRTRGCEAPRDGLFKIAQLAGFTKESFDACLKNEDGGEGHHRRCATRPRTSSASNRIPTFFINGEMLKGETRSRNSGRSSIRCWREAARPWFGLRGGAYEVHAAQAFGLQVVRRTDRTGHRDRD